MNALLTIALLLEIGCLINGHGANFWRTKMRPRERPVDVMTDVINDLGVKILDSYGEKNGNIAFSPTGLVFALAALYEGSAGRTSRQIAQVLLLPRDRRITQIGLRDINRRVRSYINADAFLGSLSFNRDDIVLRPEYEETLRWYGFTIDNTVEVNETVNSTVGANETVTSENSSLMTEGLNATVNPVTMSGVNNSVGTTPAMMMVTAPTPLAVPVATESMDSVTPSSAELIANNTNSTSNMSASLNNIDSTSAVNVNGTANATISTMPLSTSDFANDSTTINPVSATANTITSTTPMVFTASNTVGTDTNNSQIVGVNMTATTASSTVEGAITNANNLGTSTTTAVPGVATVADLNDSAVTVAPLGADDNSVRKRRSSRNRRSSYSDEGIWIDDESGWQDYNPTLPDDDPGLINEDKTQLPFLVNGCEISTISTATYTAVLPFAYIPLLHSYGVEFPLDDPRYNVILLVPTEGINSRVLVKLLDGKQLRYIRRMMKLTWIRATIPSFMLKGLISLTPHVQQLGITDAFEPRAADLSPMSLDLGVYARDVHQSIAVNIRNYMSNEKNDSATLSLKNHHRHSGNYLHTQEPIPFAVDRPFVFFIVDTETSCALIAGRIDDPLNSRIL